MSPGRDTPLGSVFSAATGGAPSYALRSLLVFSPAGPAGLEASVKDRKKKAGTAGPFVNHFPGFGRGCRFATALLGLFSLPILVRGASDGATALQQIHEAVTSLQPDELPCSDDSRPPPAAAASSSLHERVREPIQITVARCQAEATLEAYGEILEDPVLRICVLVPGRENIFVRLASDEGDLRTISEQVCSRVELLLDEECELVPTSHQAHWGLITFVAAPAWLRTSLRSIVVFDLTAVGGPLFADFVWHVVYRSEVEVLAAQYSPSRVNIYTQNCPVGWAAGTPYKLATGQVVQVQFPDTRPCWHEPPTGSLWSLWTRNEPPMPASTAWNRWLIVREDGASLLQQECADGVELFEAIAEQIGSTVSQLCFQKDVSDIVLSDFTYRGRSVLGIVAVAPRDTGPLDANFTFVDARRVGRGLRAFLRTTWSDASSILRCVNPKVPDGFSASLRTRACAGTAPDDIIWDWQEVRFRAVDCSPSGDNVEYLADANSHAEDSAGVDQTPVSHVAQGGADNAEGFYAAIATGQLNPAHLPSEGFENAPVKDKLWVLLFAPDRTPETVWISACPPLHWDDALAAVQAARDISHSSLYGHVCKVHPQPSAEFASLICLTNWAMHRTAVIFDGRAFDGRLYCLLIDPWIQWGSFLLQTGLPDNDSFVVVIKGVVHARGRPLVFSQGDMVQILEYGAAIPPVLDLDDLMFVGNSWEADPPLAFSSSFSHFWVLHEGGSRGIDADYHKIDSVYGFQEFAADVLQFAQYRTTLKTSSPRIQDAVYKGVLCKAVVLVTECLPTLPIPPARPTAPLTVVFLDMRPVLKGLDWRILVRGEIDIEVFKQGLNLDVPPNVVLHIAGGVRTTRRGVIFLQAEDRAVLTISFKDRSGRAVVDRRSADSSDSESGSGSDSSSDGEEPDASGTPRPSAHRSRSPCNRRHRRNRGSIGDNTGTSLAPLGAGAHTRTLNTGGPATEKSVLSVDHSTLGTSSYVSAHLIVGDGCSVTVDWLNNIEAIVCKLLTEPRCAGSTDQTVLAHLRYVAPRLGAPWRYMTPIGALGSLPKG